MSYTKEILFKLAAVTIVNTKIKRISESEEKSIEKVIQYGNKRNYGRLHGSTHVGHSNAMKPIQQDPRLHHGSTRPGKRGP